MNVEFVTHFNDYNIDLSQRVKDLINYRIRTKLCFEKVETQHVKIKWQEQLAHQTCWKLN